MEKAKEAGGLTSLKTLCPERRGIWGNFSSCADHGMVGGGLGRPWMWIFFAFYGKDTGNGVETAPGAGGRTDLFADESNSVQHSTFAPRSFDATIFGHPFMNTASSDVTSE